jgi:stress-induced-phosphoprotein 1
MTNPRAEAIKAEGNAFFKSGKYAEAIAKYQEATAIDDKVPSYWSNMAACFEKMRNFEEMADAGRSCIKADKSFVKGYFRLAVAYKQLDQLSDCIKTLESGLAVQSSNNDLKRMKKEVTELDLASRLDAGNADIDRMLSKVKPKFDAMERKRKSNLTPVEKFKEQGDISYKNANFEIAIGHYTKCLDQLQSQGKSGSDLALKAYANRAGELN